jgi:hypothetical protein
MSREQLIRELREIDGVLRGNKKHTAYRRALNYRVIDPSAPPNAEGPVETRTGLIECHEMRQETNQLIARRNEILTELARRGVQP